MTRQRKVLLHTCRCALLLVAGISWPSGEAEAITTCSAATPDLLFGNVADGAGVAAGTTVSIECSTLGLSLLGQARVRMCLNIDDGSAGPPGTVDRYLVNDSGDLLRFQIYRDAARSQIWGSSSTPARPTPHLLDLQYSVPLLGGTGSATVPLHAWIYPQSELSAGVHHNQFDGLQARLDYRYNEYVLIIPLPFPDSCTSGGMGGASISFGFTAAASVPDSCRVEAADDLDFGNVPGLLNTPVDQDSAITLTCTNRTAWNLSLDNGQHAAGNTRRMLRTSEGSHVSYELYRDSARALRWGATRNVDTQTGVGTGGPQTVTVHGRVPAGQAIPAGGYRDTVTLTISY